MSKELDKVNEIHHTRAIYKADGTTVIESGLFNLLVTYAKQALQRLEAIDNSNPSEALECLEDIYRNGVFISEVSFTKQHPTIRSPETNKTIGEQCDTIKQALLKAQENARSEEILQKYYQEGITLDSVRALKLRIEALEKDLEEQRELAKHYLEEQEKEIIELRQKSQEPKQYLKWEDLEFTYEEQTMKVKLNNKIYTMFYCSDEVCFDTVSIAGVFIDCCDKQFFNDLHLERVEE